MSTSAQQQDKVPSEDIIARKTDLCLSNAVVKTSIGFGAGVLASVILFRRRAFPLWFGAGAGAGSAYTDCSRSFNPYSGPGLRVVSPTSDKESSSSSSSSATSAFDRISERAGAALGEVREKAGPKVEGLVDRAEGKGKEIKGEVVGKAKEAKGEVEKKLRQV